MYDIRKDPACVYDLFGDPEYSGTLKQLGTQLDKLLEEQGDLRMRGSDIFDSYPRYSPMRDFEGFNKRGTYNPKYQ